jgi:hypothetical protein
VDRVEAGAGRAVEAGEVRVEEAAGRVGVAAAAGVIQGSECGRDGPAELILRSAKFRKLVASEVCVPILRGHCGAATNRAATPALAGMLGFFRFPSLYCVR